MKTFRRIFADDPDLNKVQNAVETVLNPIAKLPILDGNSLDSIVIPSPSNPSSLTLKIPHQLNRTPRGWFVTDINAPATVYRVSWTATTITLTASAACTLSIWIY